MSNIATPAPQAENLLREEINRKNPAQAGRFRSTYAHLPVIGRFLVAILGTALVALAVLMATELLMRGVSASWLQYFSLSNLPFWTTFGLIFVSLLLLDGLLGRLWQGVLVLSPVLLCLAWFSQQKGMYLGDPLYPSDLLYSRQVIDLMPLLVRDRPLDALLISLATLITLCGWYYCWRFFQKTMPGLNWTARAARLLLATPILIWFGTISDYSSFSYVRDRLGIVPMMWDQKENYAYNGFIVAFIFNIPMANVAAPVGYSPEQVDNIAQSLFPSDDVGGVNALDSSIVPVAMRNEEKPDIIVIMSESFWDPTRLPGVAFEEDPISHVRSKQAGHIFSPEFGGMTANVEFEALTGFSNAFLPYGSIPYQQYIRRPVPSLASFFRDQGYQTLALHPYREWFWNRNSVYKNFGFDKFISEENLPTLTKKGHLAADSEFTDEIIRAADDADRPLFLFGVSLQGHGPYAAGRYPDSQIKIVTDADSAISDASREAVRTFAQGAEDADISLKRLMDWANERKRETIIVFFGDHLPPLGDVYTESGYMQNRTANRVDTPDHMLAQHETPLVLWSNRTGRSHSVGTISPSFLPLYILDAAGFEHPYYTGFLGKVHQEYRVVDGNMLLDTDYSPQTGWLQNPVIPGVLQDFQQVQYDMLFGNNYAQAKLFPFLGAEHYSAPQPEETSVVISND